MIYITGDCHSEWNRFSTGSFPEQKELTKEDFIIVCGDFGLWHSNRAEEWWFKWLEAKNFTLLFVDGNHENFDRLYSDEFEIVDFHGGKAHKIRSNIYHLMRGYIFDLCGKKIFAFGGARSHDITDGILDPKDFQSDIAFKNEYKRMNKANKLFRVNHQSWWQQEMPTSEEMDFGLKTLAENNNEVDFIITHCCPQHIVSTFFNNCYEPDALTAYFDKIAEIIKFKKWYFGHYHNNQNIPKKYILLYEQIIRIV